MAEAFIRPPDPLNLTACGNPAHSWEKWKRKFEIYLQATGMSEKPSQQRVGLLLNHIGDQGLEIHANFRFLPERQNPAGEDNLPAENRYDYDTVISKFEDYFTRRDPQLMLREKFWLYLRRESGQSFDSWVNTVRQKAQECKFPTDFVDQAIRDKLTFTCQEDRTKLKLYDEGAALKLDKTIQILSLKEATSRELKETKTATIDAVEGRRIFSDQSQHRRREETGDDERKMKCKYCNYKHYLGKKNCPAAGKKCNKCHKMGHFAVVCRSRKQALIKEVEEMSPEKQVFVGEIKSKVDKPPNLSETGWFIKLGVGNDDLIWCIDTGAQVSVMPESQYKLNFGKMMSTDKKLLGAGEANLNTTGCVDMKLTHGTLEVNERVYLVRGASKLLLGLPAIHKLGLIHKSPGTYTVKAIAQRKDAGAPSLRTKEEVMKEYPKLFKGLGKMKGEYTIRLKEEAIPFCLDTPRRISIPLLPKVQAEINRLLKLDVIEPVDEPTEWCAPIVVAPKPNEEIRMCVDLTKLNKAVKRELYPMPTVETTLGRLSKGSIFTKLDANSGYYQIVLDPESRKLTTFITPFGRFMFKRLPYGISSASEVYQKRMDQILHDAKQTTCHVDDIILGTEPQMHDIRLKKVLDRLQDEGITLNADKCVFHATKLEYLGQIVGEDGVRQDPEKVKAIVDFQAPKDVSELRRFLGMANQLMKFTPDLAEHTKPLRDLLKKQNSWCWGQAQESAYDQIKRDLSSVKVLAMYDPNLETVVSADASKYGLGAVILQKQESGEVRPVAYASRTMTETECRYAQIEKEALAITWAVEHWKDYLVGLKKLRIETDHKPLIPLLSTKTIDELPLRIQRFRMRLMRYDYDIAHVPGKLLYTADALSRGPLPNSDSGYTNQLLIDTECYVQTVLLNLPASSSRLDEIRSELKKDDTLKVVMHNVKVGWPENKKELFGPVNKYWNERATLSIHDDLLLKGDRLVIPEVLRTDILRYLHDAHQGVTKMRENAKVSVWWPGLSRDIERVARNCNLCEKYRKERIEPMRGTIFPKRPWSRIGADFFQHRGKTYLLTVDYYSRDVEICLVSRNVDTSETISKMKKIFSRHGICDILFTDNGPQFASSDFELFANEWKFQHITSSPKYPQSNGEAERAVQTIKSILNKCDDEYLALLTYRNTPLHNGYSPAQLNMGRKLKTRIPCHPDELIPKLPDYVKLYQREREYREKQAKDYNHRHRVVEGNDLSAGDKVWIPDLKTEGRVLGRHESPRSVIIKTDNSSIRRNRRMTRKIDERFQTDNCDQEEMFIPQQIIYPEEPQGQETNSVLHKDTEKLDTMIFPPRRSKRSRRPRRRYIEEC